MPEIAKFLQFKGENSLRQRLILSLLSCKPIVIADIRAENQVGLLEYEASLLRLIEKITTGSVIQINHTGTQVQFIPGTISGGIVKHDCPNSRGIGYFLEAVVALAPFAKEPFQVTMRGITNDNIDNSVDIIRTSLLPQLAKFGIGEMELKINKRGAPPNGGGEVFFKCPLVRQLKPVQFVDQGLIKKIRGVAYVTRMSPQMANRMVESCRSMLTRYIPDVYIYTDVYKGQESGNSSGYALTLVAESSTGAIIATECAYEPRKIVEDDEGEPKCSEMLVEDYMFDTPEDLGTRVAKQILVEIRKGLIFLHRRNCRWKESMDQSFEYSNGTRGCGQN